MRQSRLMWLIEAVANVMIGYGLAVGTQVLAFRCSGSWGHSSRTLGSASCLLLCRSYGEPPVG